MEKKLRKKSATNHRIDIVSKVVSLRTYLEIGVNNGQTFLNVSIPYKVAVDPNFRFDTEEYKNEATFFFSQTSDLFFSDLRDASSLSPLWASFAQNDKLTFDIIFIDGLHTFEQSLRDFENSLHFSHKDTIWILDDTVPNDPYSCMPSQRGCIKYRAKMGVKSSAWHGDVYKTLFAIHDSYPDFSYCTIMDKGNPQTFLWHASPHHDRVPQFGSLDEIACIDYITMFKHADIFIPVKQEQLASLLWKSISPKDYDRESCCEMLMYEQFVTEKQLSLAIELEEAKKEIARLSEEKELIQMELSTLRGN